jgi:3-hydroxybutyrate dehydrogenase
MRPARRVIAPAGGEHGVTSNCISPGYARTPPAAGQTAGRARVRGIAEDDVVATIMLAENAVKRLLEPEEVAGLAVWLAGPGARASGPARRCPAAEDRPPRIRTAAP